MHVRRGDYLGDHANLGFRVAPAQFFTVARSMFRTWYAHVQFILISNDMPWTMQQITGSDIMYAPEATAPNDLALMAHADHMVVSVGTFGWWGAFLSQSGNPRGRVIYYRDLMIYENETRNMYYQYNEASYQHPNWVPISNEQIMQLAA